MPSRARRGTAWVSFWCGWDLREAEGGIDDERHEDQGHADDRRRQTARAQARLRSPVRWPAPFAAWRTWRRACAPPVRLLRRSGRRWRRPVRAPRARARRRCVEGVGEARSAGSRLAHAASKLDEQAPVAGARRLFERSLVAGVAGEQHRHDVEEGRHLIAQVGCAPLSARSIVASVHETAVRAIAASKHAAIGANHLSPITPGRLQHRSPRDRARAAQQAPPSRARATCCSGDRSDQPQAATSVGISSGCRRAVATRPASQAAAVRAHGRLAGRPTGTPKMPSGARQRRRRLRPQPTRPPPRRRPSRTSESVTSRPIDLTATPPSHRRQRGSRS